MWLEYGGLLGRGKVRVGEPLPAHERLEELRHSSPSSGLCRTRPIPFAKTSWAGMVEVGMGSSDGDGLPARTPVSRVVEGLCEWENSPQFEEDFASLLSDDEFGAMALLELCEAASRPGGPDRSRAGRDYRVPLTPPRNGATVE